MKYIIAFLCMVTLLQAELWMPSVFADGMVLQADKPVPIWGEAEVGEIVTVEFAGQVKTAVTDDSNHWKITLDPMAVSSDLRHLEVRSESSNLTFQVMVGEVWILAGQSNMGWPLSKCDGGDEAAAQANFPWLRIFKQWPMPGASDRPARDVTGGQWRVCDPQQAAQLSGVGFFFARVLQEFILKDTPVALINTQMGGTYAESWIDYETLKNTPSSKVLIDKARREIKLGVSDATKSWGDNNMRRPSALFNGKVAPIQPMAVRGVLWYQGEGNSPKWLSPGYAGTLQALIESWRSGFEQADLPFIVIQLPRFGAGGGSGWPSIRAAQAQVARALTRVELVVTIDLGDKAQIHPPDKELVGVRAALVARSKVYGETLDSSGPVYRKSVVRDGAIRIEFDEAQGLHFIEDIAAGFEICGADQVFVAAQAEVLPGGIVKVFSPKVSQPVAARYAWFSWGEVCLYNSEGLPAGPFSTKQ